MLFFQTPSSRRMSAITQSLARSSSARLSCYHLSRFDSLRTNFRSTGACATAHSARHSVTIAKRPTNSWRKVLRRTKTGFMPQPSVNSIRSVNWETQSLPWCRTLVTASILVRMTKMNCSQETKRKIMHPPLPSVWLKQNWWVLSSHCLSRHLTVGIRPVLSVTAIPWTHEWLTPNGWSASNSLDRWSVASW